MSANRTRLYGLALLPQIGWNRKIGYVVVWEKDAQEDICIGHVYHDFSEEEPDGFWTDGDKDYSFQGELEDVIQCMKLQAERLGKIPSPAPTGPETTPSP